MNRLADAHISVEMVAMLRALGHDCLDASAIPPRTPDIDILERPAAEQRVALIADKDFGELVFLHRVSFPGVVLVRIALTDEADRVAHLRSVWNSVLSRLPGSFITVTASAVRARPLP